MTITIPVTLYKECLRLVENGLFSNFSELVRSGLREEYKEMESMLMDVEELMAIEQSQKEKVSRKFKSKKQMNDFLERL